MSWRDGERWEGGKLADGLGQAAKAPTRFGGRLKPKVRPTGSGTCWTRVVTLAPPTLAPGPGRPRGHACPTPDLDAQRAGVLGSLVADFAVR